MNKSILAVIVVAMVIVAAVGAFVLLSDEESDETANYTGISTADELLAMEVNGEYKLLNDIEMSGVTWDVKDFSGKFDGKGFAITDLTLAGAADQGLFKEMSGKVNNLILKDVSIQGNAAGAIAIKNTGTITNCKVTGEIVGAGKVGGLVSSNEGMISSCTNEAEVTGSGEEIGGIVGNSAVSVSDCKNFGDVTGLAVVGGIAGTSKGVANCQNEGDVESTCVMNAFAYAGGVVGTSNGDVVGCMNKGDVTSKTNNIRRVGGIAGAVLSDADVKDNTNFGNVSGGNSVGGIVGLFGHKTENAENVISGNINEGNVSGLNFVGGIIGCIEFTTDVNAKVTVSNCNNRTDANISSTTNHVGGIVGYMSAQATDTGTKAVIKDCVNDGALETTNTTSTAGGIVATIYNISTDVLNCTNSRSITIGGSLGGIIGNYDTATGVVMTGTVSGCKNTGKLTATTVATLVGGIAGQTLRSATVTFADNSNNGELDGPSGFTSGQIVANPNGLTVIS
jgi:M26 IgA1-specific Metallo-endopeptidase N-terminal region.